MSPASRCSSQRRWLRSHCHLEYCVYKTLRFVGRRPRLGQAGTDKAKRHSTICEMTFRTAILAMRMNRKRLVVVLESELYIYDISNMQMLKTEKTSPNPNGKTQRHIHCSR